MSKAKDSFITKLKEKHSARGLKYSYENVDYRGARISVAVTCPIHGNFFASPNQFLDQGTGCPKCAGRYRTLEDLINDFNKVHKSQWDYSKVEFTKMFDKVVIGCSKHGDFEQAINDHLHSRAGCPKCRTVISKAHQKVIDYLIEIGYKENEDFLVNDRTTLFNEATGKFRELDIYFPTLKLGIEVDGVLYHGEHKNSHLFVDVEEVKRRGVEKQELCRKYGVNLLILTDVEITKELTEVKDKIRIQLSNFKV
jgi:hypothetical protein